MYPITSFHRLLFFPLLLIVAVTFILFLPREGLARSDHAVSVGPSLQDALVPLSDIVQVAVGDYHSCGLTSSGGVLCWGVNVRGQLGNGSTIDSNTPVAVNGLSSGVSAISASYNHTCALTSSGGVLCWGDNSAGQLGDGSFGNTRNTPVDVIGLSSGVIAISAGGGSIDGGHTCALTSSGGVLCWGDNRSGQLGDGSTSSRSTPVAVSDLSSGVTAISVGSYHTCALTSSGGGVLCWGQNGAGQLGNGSSGFNNGSSTPVAVSGLASGVSAISAGSAHTCVLMSSGGVLCWGDNEFGQLGDGSTTDSSTPVAVSGLSSGVTAISAGNGYTCALTSSGGVLCWGDNDYGQLGDGSTTDSSTPVAVSGLSSGVSAISTGNGTFRGHNCAVTSSGGVKCWGWNFFGQLGDGSSGVYRTAPVDVIGLSSGVSAISAGYDHTCALTSSGGALCWGGNRFGQLGDGSTTDSSIPVAVSGLSSGVTAISASHDHTCAATSSGVFCWGENRMGQLGDGSTTQSSTPVAVSGLSGSVTAIATAHGIWDGDSHTCVLTSNGSIQCWGDNLRGQLGDGSAGNSRTTPVAVSGLSSGVSAISAGHGSYGSHTCALTSSGSALCWGWNYYGQLGDGSTTDKITPMAVSGLSSGVTDVSAGFDRSCALTSSGGVQCWGANFSGRLGNDSVGNTSTPVEVSGLSSGVSAISTGGAHTCALMGSGSIQCWGRNDSGQLGDGSITDSSTPVEVSSLSGRVTAISAGGDIYSSHTCALLSSGGVQCWGSNGSGRLGNGRLFQSSVPIDVMTMPTCYSLSLDHVGNGTNPTASPANSTGCGVSRYVEGEMITLLATPSAGWEVSEWSGTSNNESVDLENTLTISTTDRAVSVTYSEIPIEDAFEADQVCGEASLAETGTNIQHHTFHEAGDVDWVKFTALAETSYQIEIQPTIDSPADVVLELYGSCDGGVERRIDQIFTPGVRLELPSSTADKTVYLRLSNAETAVAGPNVGYEVSIAPLPNEPQSGAVIIVAGRLKINDALQENIYNITDNAFLLFQANGYEAEQIYYLSPEPRNGLDDASASVNNLRYAITEWAKENVGANQALTLYLADHGDRNVFYLDDVNGERFGPTELDGWLSELEAAVPNLNVNIIIEACHSGSFINGTASIAKEGRVVITSTNVEWDAYASRFGAHFSDRFVTSLEQGRNLFTSFLDARRVIEKIYPRQQPYLEANGNNIPNEEADLDLASRRSFAYAGTLADDNWPPHIFSAVGPTQVVDNDGTLTVDVRDDQRVQNVWAVIYPPSYIPPASGNELVAETQEKLLLDATGDGTTWSALYRGFDEIGTYRIVVHAQDEDGLEALPAVVEVVTGNRLYLPLMRGPNTSFRIDGRD
ncbi:MAG: C13 family peptidase [Chloroflexota bacterium]